MKRKSSCTVVENVNWYSNYGKKKRRFLKKLKIEVLCNPTILSLFIYSDKTKILIINDICTPMFTEVLFTIAKIWKQPKCPSIDECVKKWI